MKELSLNNRFQAFANKAIDDAVAGLEHRVWLIERNVIPEGQVAPAPSGVARRVLEASGLPYSAKATLQKMRRGEAVRPKTRQTLADTAHRLGVLEALGLNREGHPDRAAALKRHREDQRAAVALLREAIRKLERKKVGERVT